MAGIPLIRSLLLQEANPPGLRSTILTPLRWILAIVLVTMLCSGRAQLPAWVFPLLGILAVLLVLAFLAAYFYLLITDRDGLRSEMFELFKTAIERGIPPDKIIGLMEHGSEVRQVPTSNVDSRPPC